MGSRNRIPVEPQGFPHAAARFGARAPQTARATAAALRLLAVVALVFVITLPATAGAAGCAGRRLLTCSEKAKAFADDVNWGNYFVLDLEPFQTRLPFHFNNPSLARFWRFEASTAGARAALEFELQYEIGDQNFEAIASATKLPKPGVGPHGRVTRRLAAKLTSLMRAEQDEVVNLIAFVTALNRATEASYQRGRADWVAWQQAAAARYARATASAISRLIGRQRAATRGLVGHHLLFGVGSEDLKLAHRGLRRHGLAPSIRSTMTALGMTPDLVQFCVRKFESTSFGQASFNLSQLFSEATAIAGEKGFQAALRHYANRIPPASRPPS